MHARNFDHSPACRESPQYCICAVQNRQTWPSPNVTATVTPNEPRTYAKAKQLIAERNTAIENARFWRRCTIVLAACGVLGNAVTFARLAGWS